MPLVSLRYFLAVWIFVHHLYPVWWMPLSQRIGTFATSFFVAGYVAVPFFFLLSGFVIFLAYGSAAPMTTASRTRFWLRRFARLTPAFYLSLIFGLFPYVGQVMKHLDSSVGVAIGTMKDLALDMSYLGVTSQRALVINYSSWTISVEAFFYVLFPFVAPYLFRLRKRDLVLATLGCVLSCIAMQLTVMHFHPLLYTWSADQFRPQSSFEQEESWRTFLLSNPLFHFPEFLLGMALARLHQLVGRVRMNADVPLLLCLGALVVTIAVLPRMPYFFPYNWLLLPVMAAATFFLTCSQGRIVTWLCHPKLLYLGEVSYVLYILHTPARDWMSFLMGYFGVQGTFSQYLWGMSFAVVFLAAAVPLHYHVNVPVTRALYGYLKCKFLAPTLRNVPDREAAEPEPERVSA